MILNAKNPIIYADVPDPDVICVELEGKRVYYMVSTTMHMTPGVPVMRSFDLVHWEIVSYVYDQLEKGDAFALKGGQNDYANGSWASSIRYDPIYNRFFVAFTCQSTDKTYIFSTDHIEEGRWHRTEIDYAKCYDNSLYFEGNKRYILYVRLDYMDRTEADGSVKKVRYSSCCLRELYVNEGNWDISLGEEKVLIPVTNYENPPQGLWGEGYHAYKVGEFYYIFMIQGLHWQRQEIVWRSKNLLEGPWEVRKVFAGDLVNKEGEICFPFTGIAQGGIIENECGKWYALLFQDYGAVGRMPVLITMDWDEEKWPVIGNHGLTADVEIPVEAARVGRDFIVADDEFENGEKYFAASDILSGQDVDTVSAGLTPAEIENLYETGELAEALEQNESGFNGSNLKLVWQWNHNPNNHLWSLTERKGWLRLKGGILSDSIVKCRNVLTQRTIGPVSSAVTCLEYNGLKENDIAGLAAFQNQYGFVGVLKQKGTFYIIMHRAMQKDDAQGCTIERKPLLQDAERIYFRVDCDFDKLRDAAYFYYSLDGKHWIAIGDTLHMHYDWPHFVGYRYGLFLLSKEEVGGYADFDFFHIEEDILEESLKHREMDVYQPPFVQPES